MKRSIFVLLLTACSLTFADGKIFESIADEAQLGNGYSDVARYDAQITKKAAEALGLAELKKERWQGCGPWRTSTGRRPAIRKITALEAYGEENTVGNLLQKLYDDKKIKAIVVNESNGSVECSLSWFNIYGTDGALLRLRYNLGD